MEPVQCQFKICESICANVLWILRILLSLRLRAVGEEHTLQNRALLAPEKTCLDED